MEVRPPAVAGRFYPADPQRLRDDVRAYIGEVKGDITAFGCVSPHAGYLYSGDVAGALFRRLQVPRRVVLLGPNHTGMGQPLAIMSAGSWQTPVGDVTIDQALAAELTSEFALLTEDSYAHLLEHSLEVQLPFLLERAGEFTFVPICVGVGTFDLLAQLGEAIAAVVARQDDPVLIVASSDMNHYETDSITRMKDKKALDALMTGDARTLYEIIKRERISMCGYGPTVAMLIAARQLGAKRAELIKYATSADVSGDRETVVGYAALAIS
jgi:AmmeMemoRadiSam system protein B